MSEQLVLRHTYDRGVAFDVSEHGNHGIPLGGVTSGAPTHSGSMAFNGGDTWIKVPPGPSFTDMRSIRVRVRFQVNPPTHVMGPARHNLVEGHLSFALFVNADFSLQATILDATGTWIGPTTTPGIRLVQPAQWHVVEFHHDGVSTGRLRFNGALVAEHRNAPGPVRPVGADGVAIGHWPHPNNVYSLNGYIDDVAIWTYDPEPDLRRLLDECCLDRRMIDKLLRAAAAGGFTAGDWTALVREIVDLGTEVTAAARAGHPANAADLSRLTREGMLAVATKDARGLGQVFTGIYDVMRRNLSDAQIDAFGQRALAQARRLPFPIGLEGGQDPARALEVLRRLARLLCLDGLVPPGKPGREPRPPKRPPPNDGDPDTDGPVGKPPPDWDQGVGPTPPDRPGEGEPERPPQRADGDEERVDPHDAPDPPGTDDDRDLGTDRGEDNDEDTP
jgi:hypothetical protein